MPRFIITACLAVISVSVPVRGAEVSGRVAMPEVCSPAVSPAVVTLEPVGGTKPKGSPMGAAPTAITLINQRGLQFVPRIRAITLGQTIRFTNEDSETHNVHISNDFNQSMAPGRPVEFTPTNRGVLTVLCDVHSHMRGYVIVSDSPWVQVCSRDGRFRFESVPEGRYVVKVWHEMGDPLTKELAVNGPSVDLQTLNVTTSRLVQKVGEPAPVRPWSEVIDRISVVLASSVDAAGRPGGLKKSRKLADDAYLEEFEGSAMETAVRLHLGFARAGELESGFRAVRTAVRDLAEGRQTTAELTNVTRKLLLALVQSASELNRKGVTDGEHVRGELAAVPPADGTESFDRRARVQALERGLDKVRELADRGEREDAALEVTAVYFDDFEPIERHIRASKPQDVPALEFTFARIRGEVGSGLHGPALATRLTGLRSDIESALDRSEAQRAGTFGPAFFASLITIVREGVEVILILTMLLALVSKAGQVGGLRAIWWGVGLAVLASGLTAVGLNRMVASAQGRTRELVEGLVMLAAMGVLFYVSFWLISQSESRRWMEFLKRRAAKGTAMGGFGTLALTAFLAVYREGAETALMYQAMVGSQSGSNAGLAGLGAGVGVGFVLLAVIALAIRATSVRLPLRTFFKVTGLVLFAMAVVFAGNGVFELQQSGILRQTPLAWLGGGLPVLGLHPNIQALSVQGLLLAGAVMAFLLLSVGNRPAKPAHLTESQVAQVGV